MEQLTIDAYLLKLAADLGQSMCLLANPDALGEAFQLLNSSPKPLW